VSVGREGAVSVDPTVIDRFVLAARQRCRDAFEFVAAGACIESLTDRLRLRTDRP